MPSLDLTTYKLNDGDEFTGAVLTGLCNTIENGVNNIDQDNLTDGEVTTSKLAAGAVVGSGGSGTSIQAASIGEADLAPGAVTATTVATAIDLSGSKNATVETSAKLRDETGANTYHAGEIGVIARAECDIVPFDDGSDPHWSRIATYGAKYTIKASDDLLEITDGETATLPTNYEVQVELDRGLLPVPGQWVPQGVAIASKSATDFTIYIMSGAWDGNGPFVNPVDGSMSTSIVGCHMTVSVTTRR